MEEAQRGRVMVGVLNKFGPWCTDDDHLSTVEDLVGGVAWPDGGRSDIGVLAHHASYVVMVSVFFLWFDPSVL